MKMTEYQDGVPSWVDLATSDLDAAKVFYGSLFSWNAETSEDPAAGGYTMFTLDGAPVAGAMGLMSPDQPVVWNTYVSVEDADKTAAAVTAGGGAVLMPPMDVMDVGRMAMFSDPEGAVFACWQPRAHAGAAVVNEPGSLTWNELDTRDPAGAKAFYPGVFGWGVQTHVNGADEYTEWQVDGRSIAGMMKMNDNFPPEAPPSWLVYFAVSDCDDTVSNLTELGGSVLFPPTTIPQGRFAVCTDPQGAPFAVMSPAS